MAEKVWQTLEKSAADGRLDTALQQAVSASEEEDRDLKELKTGMQELLMQAADDGEFEKALQDMKVDGYRPRSAEAEALREEAKKTLFKATQSGELGAALKAVKKSPSADKVAP